MRASDLACCKASLQNCCTLAGRDVGVSANWIWLLVRLLGQLLIELLVEWLAGLLVELPVRLLVELLLMLLEMVRPADMLLLGMVSSAALPLLNKAAW